MSSSSSSSSSSQHQPQLPLPSPPLPPGVQPTRIRWLRRTYGDPSHAMDSAAAATAAAAAGGEQPQQQQSQQRYVLYWMQRSVRAGYNHALEVALHHANRLGLPLVVMFTFLKSYPGANERGFAFLLEGLSEVQALLDRRGIRMVVREATASVPDTVLDTCRRLRCPLLVTDRGYERILRQWRARLAEEAPCPVLQVESDVIVPVETATGGRAAASAAMFRQLQGQHLAAYMVPLPEVPVHFPSSSLPPAPAASAGGGGTPGQQQQQEEGEGEGEAAADGSGGGGGGGGNSSKEEGGGGNEKEEKEEPPLLPDELDVRDPAALLASLDGIDRSVGRVAFKRGGPTQAKALLARFLRDRLSGYSTHRKEAHLRHQSFLSPYLHFGHISVLYVALKVQQHAASSAEDRRRFLDEMITWRETAVNFVYYHPDNYDDFTVLPTWARDSLHDHAGDARSHLYTRQELEEARTHDPLWNAAQQEMVATGYMNNYMRMLWCKSIIAWTQDPREAYRTALYLNDKYFLDGRDCNGFMGVAWCFGLFDRPMPDSPVFGQVRRMTSSGVRAKQDVDKYVAQVQDLARKARTPHLRLGLADHTYATPLRSTINAFFSPSPPIPPSPAPTSSSSSSAAAASAAAAGAGGGSGSGSADGNGHVGGKRGRAEEKGKITSFFAKKK